MSLFKGTKRIAGASRENTVSDDSISDYSVSFSDSASSYSDLSSCISALTTGSQLSKIISVIKAGLSKINTTLSNCIKTKTTASLTSLELYNTSPYIDFHYGNSTADYTSRIIESASGKLQVTASNGFTTNTSTPFIAKGPTKFKCVGSNTISSTTNDTTANWAAQGCSVHSYNTENLLYSQPSKYGLLLNLTTQTPEVTSGGEVHQIWFTQSNGNLYHRGGNINGWNNDPNMTTGAWRTIMDSERVILPNASSSISFSVDANNTFYIELKLSDKTTRRMVLNPSTKLIRYYKGAADGTLTLLMEK